MIIRDNSRALSETQDVRAHFSCNWWWNVHSMSNQTLLPILDATKDES